METEIPIQKPKSTIFKRILISVGIFFLVSLAGIVGYFIGKTSIPKTSNTVALVTPGVETSLKAEYKLSGSEVLKVVNGQSSVFFNKVTGVSEVRIGPDEKTLHFKPAEKPTQVFYCANFEEKVETTTFAGSNPPPTQPPWDFQSLGHAYTIHACEGNGYLVNSNFYVYLQLRSPQEGIIYYENLGTGIKGQVSVPAELLSGFNDGNEDSGNSYMSREVVGKDGYAYYYSHQDAKAENKLVLAFSRLIVAIDLTKNQFVGGKGFGYQDTRIVSTSFKLLNEKSLPFIVIEAGWEGPERFVGLIDVSGNGFKFVELSSLDKRPLYKFDIKPVVWENDRLVFNFLDFEELKIPDNYLGGKDILKMEDTEINNLARQLESITLAKGGYQQVKCVLTSGMYPASCVALKKVLRYQYTAKQGLIRI